MKIDTHRQVETPEGLALGLRLAGVYPRAVAALVDMLLRMALLFGFVAIARGSGALGDGVVMLAYFAMEWFYYALFEVLWNGQTPGKRWVGLRVVHDDGTRVGWSSALIRNFLRMIDFLPFAYATGIVCMLQSQSFRRVGDWAAGTVVIYSEQKRSKQRRHRERVRTVSKVEACPLPLALSGEEQAALLEFLRRQETWTMARAVEMSDHLEPIHSRKGSVGLLTVLGYATWLEAGIEGGRAGSSSLGNGAPR